MSSSIYDSLMKKEAKLSVIGLGYVGLPIAMEFAKDFSVIGFDINEERVKMMQAGKDPSREIDLSNFKGCDITFTADFEDLRQANFHVIAVPTPINEQKLPDLRPVLAASRTVGKVLKPGDYVVFESTVYPGCTEEDCIPIIEEESGLKFKKDFKVGYSPERINPGDKVNTLRTIKKIVSGCCEESLDQIAKVYEVVVDAGVHRAPSIKVAEAGKIVENVQRDLNIALVNELSIIFARMGINTHDVVEAAGTKWNFHRYTPGLVGGHCIGVDPYYLTHKAAQLGYHAKVINSGRYVNDSMGFYVGKQTVKKIIAKGKNILGSRVLIMGATFKENVADIRNSKVVDVYKELISFGVDVDLIDPNAEAAEVNHEYGMVLKPEPKGVYDAVIVCVGHKEFVNLSEDYFLQLMPTDGILVDIKSIYRGRPFSKVDYWCL
ncbi:MAG: nucleotide sugar dehydrogenase [Luteibaculum sp.]